ncbi:hypothetical protein V1294_004371 [Bradyrhizobium sp. AZCC 1678]
MPNEIPERQVQMMLGHALIDAFLKNRMPPIPPEKPSLRVV